MAKEHNKMLQSGMDYISKSLKFLPSLADKAQETLKKVEVKFRRKCEINKGSIITYVCMHHRRTDFTKYAHTKWGMDELDEDYFEGAMDSFRYHSR